MTSDLLLGRLTKRALRSLTVSTWSTGIEPGLLVTRDSYRFALPHLLVVDAGEVVSISRQLEKRVVGCSAVSK